MDFRRALHVVPGLAPDDRSTRKQMHRMGHGSMRAALAYQAVVGWIDMTPRSRAGPSRRRIVRLLGYLAITGLVAGLDWFAEAHQVVPGQL